MSELIEAGKYNLDILSQINSVYFVKVIENCTLR